MYFISILNNKFLFLENSLVIQSILKEEKTVIFHSIKKCVLELMEVKIAIDLELNRHSLGGTVSDALFFPTSAFFQRNTAEFTTQHIENCTFNPRFW